MSLARVSQKCCSGTGDQQGNTPNAQGCASVCVAATRAPEACRQVRRQGNQLRHTGPRRRYQAWWPRRGWQPGASDAATTWVSTSGRPEKR